MICIAWRICDEYRYNIQVIFIAYCNSLNKKCILQSIIEILLFILLENFDSPTASYIGSVFGIISLHLGRISWLQTQRLLQVETTWFWIMTLNLIPSSGRRFCVIIKKHVLDILYNICNSAKSHLQKAWNRISETLDFKIFRGGQPPAHPSMSHAFGVRLMFENS
jgi:hypothetical protein